jgi:triphosphoribosyl-dephospho-CoA synthase
VLEVSAEKPGNITPTHDFEDTSYEDMVRSGLLLGPELGRADRRGVGETVLAAVRACRRGAPSNTNLGIALLLAPLARAALDRTSSPRPLRDRVRAVLRELDTQDANAAYQAIRLARPGGLGDAPEHGVDSEPTIGLREAMAAAAHRDRVAYEYASDYAVTFEIGLPALTLALADGLRTRDAIVELHLRLLGALPDTLVARKRGAESAAGISAAARHVLAAGGVRSATGRREVSAFDASLRDPTNALNPGTTADLVAATVFVAALECRL